MSAGRTLSALLLVLWALLILPRCAIAFELPSGEDSKQPPIAAKAWILLDSRTGDVLVANAPTRRLPVASATKLMTAWVAMQKMPLSRIVHAAPYESDFGESLLGLRPGQP